MHKGPGDLTGRLYTKKKVTHELWDEMARDSAHIWQSLFENESNSNFILWFEFYQEPMTGSLQLYCVRVTAFSQTDLFLDWISREWDAHRSPMTNYKKLSWRHRVTEQELPLFFDLIRGKG